MAALGCSPDRCRWMSTHTQHRFSAPSKALRYGHSFLWPGHGKVMGTGIIRMCITTFPKGKPKFDQLSFTNRKPKHCGVLWIALSSLVSCTSGNVTHNISSQPDLDGDKNRFSRILKTSNVYSLSFFHHAS